MNDSEKAVPAGTGQEFEIKDCTLLAIATGRRAVDLKELRDILAAISQGSIFYHFWGGLLQPRFEEREYNNDFAAWAWYGLHDAPLAERLAVIDPSEFIELEELRQELLEIIDMRLDERDYLSWVHATTCFEFIRSQIVIFDTNKRAPSPERLAALLPGLDVGSIFYHFIDARRRLKNHGDDFSFWLSSHGEPYHELAAKLAGVDIYFEPLSHLKEQLIKIFGEYIQPS